MGFLRTSGIILISMLLFFSLVSFGTTETLEKSTKYENIEQNFIQISEEYLEENTEIEETIKQLLPFIKEYCRNNDTYTFEQQGASFEISCEEINQEVSSITESIVDEVVTTFIEENYYKEYKCDFIECLQEEKPLVLVSEKAHNYWENQSILFLWISIGLIIALFFLTRMKSNFFFISGGIIFISGFVILQIPEIVSNIVSQMISSSTPDLSQMGMSSEILVKIAKAFFAQVENIYIWFILSGILFVIIGILFKIFKIDQKISSTPEEK